MTRVENDYDDCNDPIGRPPICDPAAGSPLNNLILQSVREAEAIKHVDSRVARGLDLLDLTLPAWESAFDHDAIEGAPGSYSPVHHLFPSSPRDGLIRVLNLDPDEFADFGFRPVAEFATQQWQDEIKVLAAEWRLQLWEREEDDE